MPKDYLIRASACDHTIRIFACVSTDLVKEATEIHNLSPIAGIALGRLLTASALMGATLKGETDSLTLQVRGEGALKRLIAVSDSQGNVKGYVDNPMALIAPDEDGRIKIGKAIGKGTLTVTRDLGLKEPYASTIDLRTGEIGDDLTYYFAASEQTPTSVGLGVLYDRETVTVKVAGGFLLQLMPNVWEPYIITLEENLSVLGDITAILEKDSRPEVLIEKIFDGLDYEILEKREIQYHCPCNRERMERALMSLGKDDLKKLADEQETTEIVCDFCQKKYIFSKDEIREMIKKKD